MDKQTILRRLPPYDHNFELINASQSVGDIIAEVLDAHKVFAGDYDQIALCFDGDRPQDVCGNVLDFIDRNLHYDEQGEENQMTMSPAAMIHLKNVDCKNYAGFCGGIIDGLNRLTNRKINWAYRFASYNMFDDTPHHVFVVVNPGENEIWFDPTPGAKNKKPNWQLDKKVKVKKSDMPLYRVSGFPDMHALATAQHADGEYVGATSLTVTPKANGDDNLNWDGSNRFAGVFDPYLGLSMYRDLGGDRAIDENTVAGQINQLIQGGPEPGHTVDGAFVKWIYNNSVRSWNFYYAGGVRPGFKVDPNWIAPWPYPVLVDGRLTLSDNGQVDDYRNAPIHLLTAGLQDFINTYSGSPYPLTPQLVKEFSQSHNAPADGNLLEEPRGSSVFADIAQFLEKFGLAAPRNAYLSLVALNVFGMATNLKDAIFDDDGSYTAEGYAKIRNAWEKLGGNWNNFEDTVKSGAKKNAILGSTIGVAPAIPAWLATASAVIAIITPLVKDILKAKGLRTGVDYSVNPATGLPYPSIPGSGDSGFSLSNIGEWIKSHPLQSAAIGLVVYYFILKPNKKSVTGFGPTDLIKWGAAAYLAFDWIIQPMMDKFNSSTAAPATTQAAKLAFINQVTNNEVPQIFASMTAQEIDDCYTFLHDYPIDGPPLPNGAFRDRILAISAKYNVFT